jgi:hypothetical protein
VPDHINDIPLEQLLIYDDGELIFDGADPDTFVVLEPGTASARRPTCSPAVTGAPSRAAQRTSAPAAAPPPTPRSTVS